MALLLGLELPVLQSRPAWHARSRTEEPAGEMLAVRLTGLAKLDMAMVPAERWVNA